MFCKHCGEEIENDSTFCKYCGKKQEIETNNNKESGNYGCLTAFIIILTFLIIAFSTIFIAPSCIESCENKNSKTDSTAKTSDTSTDTNDTSTDDYMRQAGVNDLKITTRENYPTSIYYIITAERDIYDLEIDLEEYADDGTLTRTVHFYIGDLKQGEKYTMRLNISEYTDSEINNIDIVYVKVVGGKTSSLTVLPVE